MTPYSSEKEQSSPSLTVPLALGTLDGDLRDLSLSVGKAFLEIGGVLQSISARSREVTALSQSAAALTTAHDANRIIETLKGILSDTENVQVLGERSKRQMHDIDFRLEQSRTPLAMLAQLPVLLNAVGILSRIEGGRLQQSAADLSSLAADITSLKKEVEQNVSTLAEDARQLAGMVTANVQELDKTETQEREEAKSLIQHARTVLEALQAKAKSSQAAADRIDEQYTAIRTAIDKIVMSLQAEDMARQRVEHIQEALRQAASAAEAGEPAEMYLGIVMLQRAQLLSTRDLLAEAIHSINESLQSLSPRVESLTAETATLASETDREGHSLAADIEEGLGAVSSVFGRFSASARAVIATVKELLPALEGMTKSTNKLAEIEVSLRLIAINAAIKTTQLGEQGATISVLASQLQEVNGESGEQTRTVLKALHEIDHALKVMSDHGIAEDSRVLRVEATEAVNRDVRALQETVLEANSALTGKLEALLEMSRTLRAEIDGACHTTNRALETNRVFDSVLNKLDLNLEQLGGISATEIERAMKDKMSEFHSMYSMDSERLVHQSLLGEANKEESPPETGAGNGDLGDNVELF